MVLKAIVYHQFLEHARVVGLESISNCFCSIVPDVVAVDFNLRTAHTAETSAI